MSTESDTPSGGQKAVDAMFRKLAQHGIHGLPCIVCGERTTRSTNGIICHQICEDIGRAARAAVEKGKGNL